MAEQKEPEIKAKIADGLFILFETKEDCLLFTANMGDWRRFQQTYHKIMQELPLVRHYRERREPEAKIKCAEMMQRTLLSDGMTLMEAVKRKVAK